MTFAAVLRNRGAKAAEAARKQESRRVADVVAREIGGIAASVVAEGVRIEGRGLAARAAFDGRLRWLATYWRDRRFQGD